MGTRTTDVVIIGGGTMGTATGWALARQGVQVTVLERFGHVHAYGSHGGKTRIFRHAYAEGARYVPWALEADRLWSGLQERTGGTILNRVGCIDISAPGYPRAREARASAEQYGLAHEWLTGADVNERWPIWNLPGDREVCFGPDAGFLDIAGALGAMASEMTAHGGVLHDNTPVLGWSADEREVRVETATDTWVASKLVLAAGAWSTHLLADLGIPLEVRRKPVLWFEVDGQHAELAKPERMPVFISDDQHGEFYGIPQADGPGVKVGMHSGGEPVDPETVNRSVGDDDIRGDIWPFISRSMHGFTGRVTETAVCMYTMTPDEDFVMDYHPHYERVVFATGFSGHGFKFAPVVGEYLASLAASPVSGVLPEFALARFAAREVRAD